MKARWRWAVNVTPRPPHYQERDTVPMPQEAGSTPGPVWTGAEYFAPQPGFGPGTVQPTASRQPTELSRLTVKTFFSKLAHRMCIILFPADWNCRRHKSVSFRCLWPCIVSKLWSERVNQQDATVRCLFLTISQHVSGIIMPIFRRTRRMLLHVLCCAASAGCGC